MLCSRAPSVRACRTYRAAIPRLPSFYSVFAGVLFRFCQSSIPLLPEFYSGFAEPILLTQNAT